MIRRTSRFIICCLALPAAVDAETTLLQATASRRAELARAVPDGIVIVQSADRSQPNLLEFMLPDSENHDFLYLTGIDTVAPPGATLVLNPHGAEYREILYTSEDPEKTKAATGITHAFPVSRLLDDLSSALSDYRNLRITQLRFKPVASDLSRGFGPSGTRKAIYLNYPRFTNLAEPPNPRFALAERLRQASPEIVVNDVTDLLDRQRMIHDPYELSLIRRAVRITAKGLGEGMKHARPGIGSDQIRETIDYVYRLNGGAPAFDTSVQAGPAGRPPVYATAREEHQAHGGSKPIAAGDLIHVDTGAEYQHYASDVQRTFPASGRFTPEQRKVYEGVLAVQKAVIGRVRPGVYWRDLQALAVEMLREAGGWDRSYTYGIGHFVGLDVHDPGDYTTPLQAGMVLTIEQGAIVEGTRFALEDTVLVTEDGHDWLSRMIPIETAEIEAGRAPSAPYDLTQFVVGDR